MPQAEFSVRFLGRLTSGQHLRGKHLLSLAPSMGLSHGSAGFVLCYFSCIPWGQWLWLLAGASVSCRDLRVLFSVSFPITVHPYRFPRGGGSALQPGSHHGVYCYLSFVFSLTVVPPPAPPPRAVPLAWLGIALWLCDALGALGEGGTRPITYSRANCISYLSYDCSKISERSGVGRKDLFRFRLRRHSPSCRGKVW